MELDKLKLLHDHTKHVTTLATGSILVLIAFYDKLPITPIIKILVLFSLFFFIFLYFSLFFFMHSCCNVGANDNHRFTFES